MPTEPRPRRSDDELLVVVHAKTAALRRRRTIAALGASALLLLLVSTGVAIAGNGGDGKSTVRAASVAATTTVAETTTSTEGPTSTTAEVTSTTTTSAPKPPIATTTTAAPAGLAATVEAHPFSAEVGTDVHFTVHVTDGDGSITRFSFAYGDGTEEPGPTVQDSCSGPPPASRRPRRTDTTYEFVHRYQSPGSFEAKADVTSGGLCSGIPQEQRTASATFTATGGSGEPTTTVAR